MKLNLQAQTAIVFLGLAASLTLFYAPLSAQAPAAKEGDKGKAKGGPPAPAPANLPELSEKDVLNVLGLMQQEFNVDPNRTHLMGH